MNTEHNTQEDPQNPDEQFNDEPDILGSLDGETIENMESPEQIEQDPMIALEQERDQVLDQLRRVSADYQNYMKRSEERLVNMIEYAKGDLLRNFIPIIDHFDRALTSNTNEGEAPEDNPHTQGIRIVRDEFLNVMKQAGVSRIEPEVGEPFNPEAHEAMLRQPAEGIAPNHISLALQPGYIYQNRVLRPAQVAVAPEE